MIKLDNNFTILEDCIKYAKKNGATEVEAIQLNSNSITATWRLNKCDTTNLSNQQLLGIRILYNKQQAITSTTINNLDNLYTTIDNALSIAKSVPSDPYNGLVPADKISNNMQDLDIYDKTEPTLQDLLIMAQEAEDASQSVKHIINSEGSTASWSKYNVLRMTSNGIKTQTKKSYSSISSTAIASKGDSKEVDYDYCTRVYLKDLRKASAIGLNAGNKARKKLNPRNIKTGVMPVIFNKDCASSLLSIFLSAINGTNVCKKNTFLLNDLNKKIANNNINIIDDPLMIKGLASKAIDSEGFQTTKRTLVENGHLTQWILDFYCSKYLNTSHTGYSYHSAGDAPNPSTANTFISNGQQTEQELIKSIKQGVYICDTYGPGVNILNGNYSKGCNGFWIENGEITYPLNEFTIAGNLRDMLANIIPASNLIIDDVINSPSLLIDKMTIAGK